MKFFISITTFFFYWVSFSQSILVKETNFNFSNGKHNSLTVNVPYAELSYINKQLKGELKDWKGKYKESKGEHSLKLANQKEMGEKPFDVYARVFESSKNNYEIVFAIDLGGAYLSSDEHNQQYQEMVKKIKKLAMNISKKSIEKELDNEKDKLKDLEKQNKNLLKEENKLSKQIEDYTKQIEENKNRIQDLKKMKEIKSNEIKNQEKILKKVEEKKKKLN